MDSPAARILVSAMLLALACCPISLEAGPPSEGLGAESGGIGLWADDPERDYIIAGIAILLFLLGILGALYYIALKEED